MARLASFVAALSLYATAITAQDITVTPLEKIDANAVGLVTPQTAGIPADFWGDASAPLIAHLIDIQHHHQMPEARAFLNRLMVTELTAAKDDENGINLILSRVDWLLDNGALDAADALLQKATAQHPELFKRWFNAKLMLGTPDQACEPLQTNPALSNDLATKVFCLAQNSDWFSAELTLVSGMYLGAIEPKRAELLAMFLEPDLMDDQDAPAVQNASDPLEFAIREALALPRPRSGITLSQLHVDLDDSAGWLAQLRAGEALARVNAIPARYLDALYSDGQASASGGVWDRVSAIADLRKALNSNDADNICNALIPAWDAMHKAKLVHVLAENFAEVLAAQDLPDYCVDAQIQTIVLHHNFGTLMFDLMDYIPSSDILNALITLDFSQTRPDTELENAIVSAFRADRHELISPAQSILTSLADTTHGIETSPISVEKLLATLLDANFTAEAQRLALQYVILERAS